MATQVYHNRNDNVAVDTTAVQVLALVQAPTLREVYAIKNTSTGAQKITLSIGLGTTAVSGSGIQLNAGESWTESIEGTFIPTQEPISVIADNAGATISIYERTRG